MRFTPDRCLSCGAPGKPSSHVPIGRTHYWLCSDDCIDDAVNEFIDPRYKIGKTAHDVPEIKKAWELATEADPAEFGDIRKPLFGLFGESDYERNYKRVLDNYAELKSGWDFEQKRQIEEAVKKFGMRAHREFIAEKTKEYDKLEAEHAKKEQLAAVQKAIDEARSAEAARWKPKKFQV
jgi:hypothetical protein